MKDSMYFLKLRTCFRLNVQVIKEDIREIIDKFKQNIESREIDERSDS